MTKPQLISVFPLLVKHLSSSNYVVHTYSAIAIERLTFMRKDNVMLYVYKFFFRLKSSTVRKLVIYKFFFFRFTKADIKRFTQELLINLFRLIEAGTTPETLAE